MDIAPEREATNMFELHAKAEADIKMVDKEPVKLTISQGKIQVVTETQKGNVDDDPDIIEIHEDQSQLQPKIPQQHDDPQHKDPEHDDTVQIEEKNTPSKSKHNRRYETLEGKNARKAWKERGLVKNTKDPWKIRTSAYIKLLVKNVQRLKGDLFNKTRNPSFVRLTSTKSFTAPGKNVKDHPILKYLHLKSADNDVAEAVEEYLLNKYDSAVVMVNIKNVITKSFMCTLVKCILNIYSYI